ncbi:hypothetical protein ULF88_03900 [Halopseudomonas pachastrellae]|nr:hypothetical protein [Halopseudomonas pachastrellae]
MPLGSSDIDLYESEDPIWNPALLTIPIPGIRKMVNLASTMNDVIHLSIGQPDLPAPDTVVEASVEALRAGQTGYTWTPGCPSCSSRSLNTTASAINGRSAQTTS